MTTTYITRNLLGIILTLTALSIAMGNFNDTYSLSSRSLQLVGIFVVIGFVAFVRSFRVKLDIIVFTWVCFLLSFLVSSIFGVTGNLNTFLNNIAVIFIAMLIVIALNFPYTFEQIERLNNGVGLILSSSAILLYLLGISWSVQSNYFDGFLPIDFRLKSITPHANYLAEILSLSIVFALFFLLKRSSKASLLLIFLSVPVLLLTQSKTSVTATLLSVSVLYLHHFPRRFKGSSKVGIIIIFTSIVFFAAFKYSPTIQSYTEDYGSYLERIAIWDIAVNEWSKNWIFGYSPNLWNEAMNSEYFSVFGKIIPHSHNQILQVGAETGWIGLSFFIVLILSILLKCLRSIDDYILTFSILVLISFTCTTEAPIRSNLSSAGTILMIYLALALNLEGALMKRKDNYE